MDSSDTTSDSSSGSDEERQSPLYLPIPGFMGHTLRPISLAGKLTCSRTYSIFH